PHYSSTTTGSSLNEWNRLFVPNGAPVRCIRDFYRNPMYLDAVVEKVEQALARFRHPEEAELIFSAHSVPVAVVQKGDPYQRQIEETVRLVMQRGAWPNRHRLCYQSKVGASKWLQPTLRGTLRELGEQGAKQVCVVPISFVSDHVETLGEIDHEAREQAEQLGITQFEMSAGLNDSPKFIAALADVVMTAAGLHGARHHAGLVAAD
ncbi:MAG TPA: ferrochelatase, partial [Terriglobales bacterium]|nr:ferrochelatase [Terriglobales bacterium]